MGKICSEAMSSRDMSYSSFCPNRVLSLWDVFNMAD